jgi:hypothetical protein
MHGIYSNLISYKYIASTIRCSGWANTSRKIKSFICGGPKKSLLMMNQTFIRSTCSHA